jgi:peptide subunit release factor 1 (eRF1)
MKINELDPAMLRRLSAMRPRGAKVVSIYLNLDPSDFATPPARQTAIASLLDEADRRAREDGLDHDERTALREDLERARRFFEEDFSARGAGSVAVFACGPEGLFEAVRLPRPLGSEVVIDDAPAVAPLVRVGGPDALCVVLVSRRNARILRGTRDRLEEVATVADDVHGKHDQGGWSQARYERGIEKEVADHLERAAERVFRSWKRRAFDRLAVGATEELWPLFERHLHPYVRERFVGRFDVDVETANADRVLEAASPLLERHERAREREALDRLAQGLGGAGRAAAGLDDVLGALNERRVETLLLADGASRAGVSCPRCGWLGVEAQACPLDGAAVDRRDDVLEDAVEAAVLQSAEPIAVRHHGDLAGHGDVAALLRF